MKYTITFNVLNKSGWRTPVRASVEIKDLSRPAAIKAALAYIDRIGISVVDVPSSVRASGITRGAKKRSKVSLPRL